jgi:formylglycine-generating enzyme required for sulfatase activity
MKHITWILLALALVLVSCAPASTPTPTTAAPPTLVPSPTSVPPTTAPTLVPVALAGPQSGTTITWLDGGQLVYVPAGDFIMGTGAPDAPQKTVSLDSYWIGKTDVTNKMYAQCVATGNCAPPAQELGTPVFTNPSYGDYPIVGVTWDMAANYCKWTQGQLPTEAQWEKTARGSQGSKYPWGNDSPSCDLLNFLGCFGHTTSVTNYVTGNSPYGLTDMSGNIFQWVNDFYDQNYYDSMPASNPTGPGSGDTHVIRGSSFESDASQTPAGVRHFGAAAYHHYDLGFRCVVSQPKTYAPYCQTNSYLSTGIAAAATGSCQSPDANVLGNFCTAGAGYATVNISQGATYQIGTKGYSCSEGIINGQRVLTCHGPNDSSGQITVCNASCSSSPSSTAASPVCDPGYTLNTSTGACTYQPITIKPNISGCPQGYNLIARGDQKICAIGKNQDGHCPAGLYFDSQYGACVPPSGLQDAPYGIDNSALAAQTFQGCAPGYSYDSNYQCCQANTGGTYPGCALGYTFDSKQNTCVPNQVQTSGPGCVTVQVNILKCSQPIDYCSPLTQAPVCIRTPGCTWDSKTSKCSLIKANP